MGVLNKIGKGLTLIGLVGGLYTCNCTVPKPLLDEGDHNVYSSYGQHPDYYWLPATFGGVFFAGLVLEGSTSAYEKKKKNKEKKEE